MNVENLKKLALFLWDLPEEDATKRFDMMEFNSRWTDPHNVLEDKHICQTASCAVGWGPSAGIIPNSDDFSWGQYCRNHLEDTCTKEWYWMFSSGWAEADNTPKGAAKRIFWLLEKGSVPEVYQKAVRTHTSGRTGRTTTYEEFGDEAIGYKKAAVELYKDWIPDVIQSRDSLRVPVLDQNQPPEGGDLNKPSFSDPV